MESRGSGICLLALLLQIVVFLSSEKRAVVAFVPSFPTTAQQVGARCLRSSGFRLQAEDDKSSAVSRRRQRRQGNEPAAPAPTQQTPAPRASAPAPTQIPYAPTKQNNSPAQYPAKKQNPYNMIETPVQVRRTLTIFVFAILFLQLLSLHVRGK
jgi:hypothetical protein